MNDIQKSALKECREILSKHFKTFMVSAIHDEGKSLETGNEWMGSLGDQMILQRMMHEQLSHNLSECFKS
jgi:hypothetical protein